MRRWCALLALLVSGEMGLAQSHDIAVFRPVGAPRIISDFGSVRGVNGLLRGSVHQGIDILGYSGLDVIAAAAGTVLAVDNAACWGPTVVVDHGVDAQGQALIALYGHLGETTVETGQRVARGDTLGRLGDNQNAFACIGGVRHLHFQLGRTWLEDGGNRSLWARLFPRPGHSDATKYLEDGEIGLNPHLYWADGPGRITCFVPDTDYPAGTLTYPMACE